MNTLQENISGLTKKDHLEYVAAKQRGYLLDHTVGASGSLWHAYGCWCAFESVPFVGVRVNDRFLRMMFTETYKSFTPYGEEEMRKVFEKYDTEYTEAGGNVATVKGARVEDLELLAREMLQTILKPGVLDPPLGEGYAPPQVWIENISRGWS